MKLANAPLRPPGKYSTCYRASVSHNHCCFIQHCFMCQDGGDIWECNKQGCGHAICSNCIKVSSNAVSKVKADNVKFKCVSCHWKISQTNKNIPYFISAYLFIYFHIWDKIYLVLYRHLLLMASQFSRSSSRYKAYLKYQQMPRTILLWPSYFTSAFIPLCMLHILRSSMSSCLSIISIRTNFW